MIASFEHKFIYVKGWKVASTSIEIALTPCCGPSDIVTPITPADEFHRIAIGGICQNYANDAQLAARYLQLVRNRKFKEALDTCVHSPHPSRFYNHMPLSDIEARLTLPFNEYSVVISERNPYAKIISLANWELSFSDYCGEAMENSVDDIRRSIGHLFRTGHFRTGPQHRPVSERKVLQGIDRSQAGKSLSQALRNCSGCWNSAKGWNGGLMQKRVLRTNSSILRSCSRGNNWIL